MSKRFKISLFFGLFTTIIFGGCKDSNIGPGDTQTYVKFFGGPFDNAGFDVVAAHDGGFVLVGRIQNTSAKDPSDFDIYVSKVNSVGNEEWFRTLGGSNDDIATGIVQTSDGGYGIVGTLHSNLDTSQVFLAKLDGSGNTVYSTSFGDATHASAGTCIDHTPDGGFIIGGTRRAIGFEKDILLYKVDISGIATDVGIIGDSLFADEITSISYTTNLGVTEYIGSCNLQSSGIGAVGVTGGTQVAAIVIFSEFLGAIDGRPLSSVSGAASANKVLKVSDSEFYLTGNSASLPGGNGGQDIFLAKFIRIPAGLQADTFTTVYGTGSDDFGYDLIQNGSDFIICGSAGTKSILIKTNANGGTIPNPKFHTNLPIPSTSVVSNDENHWMVMFGGKENDQANAVTLSGDGGYIVVGFSLFQSTSMISLTKTNSTGTIK